MGKAVIIPTYNERENIAPLIDRLLSLPGEIHLVVVDDNSPDGTGDLVEAAAREEQRVHLYRRTGKLGLGTAVREGFRFALDRGARFVAVMDADFSHDPARLPALFAACETHDLAVGTRYVAGGGVKNWPRRRIWLSRWANRFARLLLSLRAHDATTGFRCFRRDVADPLCDAIRSSGYSFYIETTYWCQTQGFSLAEVPIEFINRSQGTSKISRGEIGKALWTVVRLAGARLRPGRGAAR